MNLRQHPFIIALFSAAVGGVGCLVVGNLLPEPHELRQPLPHHLASSDRQLKASMGALFGSNHVPGNKVETLVNGVQIFPAILRAIREARQTISFETYIYWRGAIANEFADSLSAKVREGLSVKVLLDGVGSITMDDGLLERVQDADVEVVRFRPINWYTIDRPNNRTHRKLLVVDGRVGFTGGMGIADEWNGDARATSEWRDNHYRLEGPSETFLIAGYEPSTVALGGIGRLVLAAYQGDRLVYVGGVGTGLTQKTDAALKKQLDALVIEKPAIARKRENVRWSQPVLAAEVAFRAWTDDGKLRRSKDCARMSIGSKSIALMPSAKAGSPNGETASQPKWPFFISIF